MRSIALLIDWLIVSIIVICVSGVARAQSSNCDCQELVGSCSASITVIPTKSEKGSYAVDLTIQSSAPACSKVDYYIDSTPYFTILSQGNRGTDSSWGQKPITRENINGVSCKICKSVTHAGPQGDVGTKLGTPKSPLTLYINGTWCAQDSYGSNRIVIANGTITFAFSGNDGSKSGNTGTVSLLSDTEFTVHLKNGFQDRYQMVDKDHFRWVGRGDAGAPQDVTAARCGG